MRLPTRPSAHVPPLRMLSLGRRGSAALAFGTTSFFEKSFFCHPRIVSQKSSQNISNASASTPALASVSPPGPPSHTLQSESSSQNYASPVRNALSSPSLLPNPSRSIPSSAPPLSLIQQAAAANREFSRPDDNLSWRPVPSLTSPKVIWSLYRSLAKSRLSILVVLTAMAGYAISPTDPASASLAFESFASSLPPIQSIGDAVSRTTYVVNVPTLLATAGGTGLCAASTNAINEMVEYPYDAQMARTRNRPLVRRHLSPLHAVSFAGITGSAGVGLLWAQANPLTAMLGLANIILYAFIYTPSKRYTIANTWIGAVVGALPPLMGWAACTNSIDPISQPGAWLLFGLLYAWQFPHFNALAWSVRREYAQAGYRMMAALNPQLNARVSLRYTLSMFPICLAFPYLGIASPLFGFLSTIPNAFLSYAAWEFWSAKGPRRNPAARRLFFASLLHLPAVLVLLMVCKTTQPQSKQAPSDKIEDVAAL